MKKRIKILLCLLLVTIPLIFVWMTELLFYYGGGNLTNGFMDFDGLMSYHFWMYLMFSINFITAFSIIDEMIKW